MTFGSFSGVVAWNFIGHAHLDVPVDDRGFPCGMSWLTVEIGRIGIRRDPAGSFAES